MTIADFLDKHYWDLVLGFGVIIWFLAYDK